MKKWYDIRILMNQEIQYNHIHTTKKHFNCFFQDELYGRLKNLNNIILSRGGWNDNFATFPKIFLFCLQYALRKHWTGYSHSFGHKNAIDAVQRLANAHKKKSLYTQDNVALTLGNSFTIGVVFKQLQHWFPDTGIIALKPYYPPILKSISSYFRDFKLISSLQNEGQIIIDISSATEETGYKILFLSNFIGVEGRTFSKAFWSAVLQIVKKRDLFLVIDEGLAFEPLQYPENINDENVLRIVSISKKYGVPGMKLGFMLGGKKFMNEFYDYASTNYGGPLSAFFLLSEFLYEFEHAYMIKDQLPHTLKRIQERYNIPALKIRSLYDDFAKTLEKNIININHNIFIFESWSNKYASFFEKKYVYGGINIFLRPKIGLHSCYQFFIHAVTKHCVSVMPGKCLGDTTDSLIRVTLLEPTSVFKEGLERLGAAFESFIKEIKRVPRAVFLDFDGTLTDDKSNSITEDPGALLIMLMSKNIFSALATGKGLYFVRKLLKNHQNLLDNYYVLYDGALVINPDTQDILFSKPIPSAAVKILQERLSKITNNFYLNKVDGLYSQNNHLPQDSSLFTFWKKENRKGDVYQIYIRDITPEQIFDIEKALKHECVSWYSFRSRRGLSSIIAHHKDADKGTAIKCVLKDMHIKESETIIIGDGINDLPSFRLKQVFKIAPPHAVPNILELADVILDHGQGIKEYLEEGL